MANWLRFDKIEDWEYVVLLGFQYDDVSNEDIAAALLDTAHLAQVDTSKDWEDDRWLHASQSIPEAKKHAYRVAAIVRELQVGGAIKRSISLDTFSVAECRSCVSNGHHRVRALQYMGLEMGPFSLAGRVDALEELVGVAGVDGPGEFAHLFAQDLLDYDSEDITLSTLGVGMP